MPQPVHNAIVTPHNDPHLCLKLQFFDALIVAGAERANCDTVYSEDMTDGARYGKVTIVNPFKVGNK